jgi:predicted acylesterase/phospholipase RssA
MDIKLSDNHPNLNTNRNFSSSDNLIPLYIQSEITGSAQQAEPVICDVKFATQREPFNSSFNRVQSGYDATQQIETTPVVSSISTVRRPIISPINSILDTQITIEYRHKNHNEIKSDTNEPINLALEEITLDEIKLSSSSNITDEELHPLLLEEKQSWYPRVLVIGPGGVKGLKVLGFLSPVEDSGLLEYVDTYCGVSVGALISLLIICGYHIREIVGEAVKLDIFKEIVSFNFKSITENLGFISNEPVRKLLTQLVINKFGNVPTLYGLYMRTGKAFVAVTLNATDETCVMLNPFCNPDVSCVEATMFSMNIPFVFYQLIHRGKTYVDGALANPYPIDYFDDGKTNILGIYMKTIHTKSVTSSTSPNPHLGSGMVAPTIIQRVDEDSSPLPIGAYSLKIIQSLMDHRRNHIIQQASDCCKHVCLETKTTDTIGYSVTIDDKALMLVEGFNEGKAFLVQLKTNTYKRPKIPEKQRYKYPPYFMMENTNSSEKDNIEVLAAMTS